MELIWAAAEAKQTIFSSLSLYLCRLRRRHVYVHKCALFVVCAWLFVNATDWLRFYFGTSNWFFRHSFLRLMSFCARLLMFNQQQGKIRKARRRAIQQRQRWKKKPNKTKLPLAMTITLKHFFLFCLRFWRRIASICVRSTQSTKF